MTSNPKEGSYDIFFQVLDDWRKYKEKAFKEDASYDDVEFYYSFCKDYYTHFSKLFLKMTKPDTIELCTNILTLSKEQMTLAKKKLDTMTPPKD